MAHRANHTSGRRPTRQCPTTSAPSAALQSAGRSSRKCCAESLASARDRLRRLAHRVTACWGGITGPDVTCPAAGPPAGLLLVRRWRQSTGDLRILNEPELDGIAPAADHAPRRRPRPDLPGPHRSPPAYLAVDGVRG